MSAALVFLKFLLTFVLVIAGGVLLIWGGVKGIQGLVWLLARVFRGIGFLVRHVFGFVRATFVDAGRSVGALLTAAVLFPLTLLNFLFGRWNQGRHYARALEDELVAFGLGVYNVALGNPLKLVGLGVLTDGFERRLPEVVARAPRAPKGSPAAGKFAGYKVTGTLPAGGSGARLFLAKPRPQKLEELLAAGHADPGQVVIKAFDLGAGSTMPQIVRESRALEAARRLGLVLEHELGEASFFYVMPYVPGENLDVVITRLHEDAAPAGLSDRQLRICLGYTGDLLYTLDAFHGGGLWHKDIKPSNLIVSSGRAHLVDLGLVTPLESAMTLTTHGTEYYRDPEMVRLALKGVKVHEVNGVKFDIYSTGAVLYSMIEDSFPAQGSLSKINKRCPEAVRWIVRRAMADLDVRYGSAQEMLADIRTVLAARDPFSVRPADLPSMGGKSDWSLRRASFQPGGYAAASQQAGRAEPLRPVRGERGRLDTATFVKERRRSTGRSLAAAFIGFLFLAGGVLVALAVNHEGPFGKPYVPVRLRPQSEARADSGPRYVPPSYGPTAETAPPAPDAPVADAAPPLTREERRLRQKLVRYLKLDELPAGDDGQRTLLVLQDLAPTTDRSVLELLERELGERGIAAYGLQGAGLDEETELAYVAGARKAVGLAEPASAEARDDLQLYLTETPVLDGAIWLTQGESAEDVRVQLVRPLGTREGEQAPFAIAGERTH
ncbi:MAG: hypothetical protein H6828_03680 [Planctomycetes bacterium]|nr:hypothetical protein [Planctomycetota bacterium]